jgi:DNA polymerase III alpha subunit (gram-positive type)
MYELYVVDSETTGLSYLKNEPIEISIYRLSTNEQRTWFLRPINLDHISNDALRVNGAKLEDLQGKTKEGREKYNEPSKVLVEIENWLAEDMMASEDRIMTGQNVQFDKLMLESLWDKCGAIETFPFNKKYIIDTMQIAFMIDYVQQTSSEGYSLYALTKKYGIKNEKAHSSESDVKATVCVFNKLVNHLRKMLKTNEDSLRSGK